MLKIHRLLGCAGGLNQSDKFRTRQREGATPVCRRALADAMAWWQFAATILGNALHRLHASHPLREPRVLMRLSADTAFQVLEERIACICRSRVRTLRFIFRFCFFKDLV